MKFSYTGLLAITPHALTAEHAPPSTPRQRITREVVIVDISGPLVSRPDATGFDNYEAIIARVREALASPATAVVLHISSPGGLVAGCFEAARAIRARAARAGKPLVAFVDDTAASAAYALACAAETIYATPTAQLGSIGVLATRVDLTAADEAMGVRAHLISSGSRKSDGAPSAVATADELAALQRRVDATAGVFFAWVAEARGMTADAVASLQAGMFVGADAVTHGLADVIVKRGVGSVISTLAPTSAPSTTQLAARAPQKTGMVAMAQTNAQTTPPRANRVARTASAFAPSDAELDRRLSRLERYTETTAQMQQSARAANTPAYAASASYGAPERAELQRLMGLGPTAPVRVNTPTQQFLGAAAPAAEPRTRRAVQKPIDLEHAQPTAAALDLALKMGVVRVESTGVVSTETKLVLGAPIYRSIARKAG